MQHYSISMPFVVAIHGDLRRAIAKCQFRRVHCIFEIKRQRGQLAELSDHQLSDIGISRAQANIEAARPCWVLPEEQMFKINP